MISLQNSKRNSLLSPLKKFDNNRDLQDKIFDSIKINIENNDI